MLANQKLARAHYMAALVWLIAYVVMALLKQRDVWEVIRMVAYFSIVPIAHILLGGICEAKFLVGKILTLAISAVELIIFPVGTILGGILLWLCVPTWATKEPSKYEELAKGWPRG